MGNLATPRRVRVAQRPTDIASIALTPIPDNPGYYTEPGGRFFLVQELVPYPDDEGYVRVRTMKGGKRKRPGVHTLTALAYLPPPLPGQNEVRHLDGNKKNNAVGNLAWGTRKENGEDKARHGSSKGTRNGRNVLSEQAVREIKRDLRDGVKTQSQIASEHGVSNVTISAINSGRLWGWLE